MRGLPPLRFSQLRFHSPPFSRPSPDSNAFDIHFGHPDRSSLEAGGSPLLQQGERRFSVAERVAFDPLGFKAQFFLSPLRHD